MQDEPPRCRYIWKRYLCGGVFQSKQVHHCSEHPPGSQCPAGVVDHYEDTGKNCRTCQAIEKSYKRIQVLQKDMDTLRMAQPPDPSAIDRQFAAIEKERYEISAWRTQGHVDR